MIEIKHELYGPAEMRAAADFLIRLADMREREDASRRAGYVVEDRVMAFTGTPVDNGAADNVPSADTPEGEAREKKSPRSKPAAPPISEAIEAPKSPEPLSSVATPGADAPTKTHDDIRVLMGALGQSGKRVESVALVRSYGVNGVGNIPADKLDECHAKLEAML